MAPIYFVVLDCSFNSVTTGLIEAVVHSLKSFVGKIPDSSRYQIGFITFDTTLHFYSLRVLPLSLSPSSLPSHSVNYSISLWCG